MSDDRDRPTTPCPPPDPETVKIALRRSIEAKRSQVEDLERLLRKIEEGA